MTQEQLRMQMLAGIITEGQYKAKLNEGKQVGTLYHFTYITALREILNTNVLGHAEGLESSEPELYRKNIASDNKYGRISLTRNKNFNSVHIKNPSVCLVLDGDKISQNTKIKPYHFDPSHRWDKDSEEYKRFVAQYGKDAFEDQMEETVPIIKNLDRYLTKVIIFKNNIEYDPFEDFEPEEFQEIFQDCIEILKEKNIPYEIK
jgi:hypothetical protein